MSIGDRTVGGLCSRDPFVGPWQVPVADCAVTAMSFRDYAGEAYRDRGALARSRSSARRPRAHGGGRGAHESGRAPRWPI